MREGALPDVGGGAAAGLQRLAPGVGGAVETAAGGKLPLGLGGVGRALPAQAAEALASCQLTCTTG